MRNNAPVIMGILNVTPDSFSDGGRYTDVNAALEHAQRMAGEGATILDIGGESTRPGSRRINADEQVARVEDIVRACRENLPGSVTISIDTTLAAVAERALLAGAGIINDVSAGRDDPAILELAAQHKCPYILMHMQGTPRTMQDDPHYDDVVYDVKRFLLDRAQAAINAGLVENNIVIDPGIGFGKTRHHNLELLQGLRELVETGFPVLLGASRKRFMGSVCEEMLAEGLVAATCATTALGVMAGVKYFRVHDVRENHQAAVVAWAIKTA